MLGGGCGVVLRGGWRRSCLVRGGAGGGGGGGAYILTDQLIRCQPGEQIMPTT